MATVFRARCRHGSTGPLVAIKRIHGHLARDPQFIRMFLDEARIAAALAHPSIVELLDLGCVDGQYYMALEHVHGRDLSVLFGRHQARGEAMPIAQTCYLGIELCAGLEHVHQRCDPDGRALGLVHRDVSLPNLLLSFEGELKIIDFGIALAEGRAAVTDTGTIKGKLAYMSPEQLAGGTVDHRSDIFAAGIVLFELLTGKRLFLAESPRATAELVRAAHVPRLSQHDPRIPTALERIVHKALARDPQQRYQSARELGDALLELVQAQNLYSSRRQMAAWLQGLYGDEYAAQAARLATERRVGLLPAWSSTARLDSPHGQQRDAASEQPIGLTSQVTSLWGGEPTRTHYRERLRPHLPLPPAPEEPGALAASPIDAARTRPLVARPIPAHACAGTGGPKPPSIPSARRPLQRPVHRPLHRPLHRQDPAQPHHRPAQRGVHAGGRAARCRSQVQRHAGGRPWSAFLIMLAAVAACSSVLVMMIG